MSESTRSPIPRPGTAAWPATWTTTRSSPGCGPCDAQLGRSGSPVGVADGLCVQLGLGECGRYWCLAGDGLAELAADVGAEVLELRDVQEPDAGVGHRLEGRVCRVGGVDRRQRERAVGGRQVLVLRDLVAGEPAARWHVRPAELLPDGADVGLR